QRSIEMRLLPACDLLRSQLLHSRIPQSPRLEYIEHTSSRRPRCWFLGGHCLTAQPPVLSFRVRSRWRQRGGCPMTQEDAFLRAIRAEPEVDAPRLIFADWLEE